MTTDLRMLIEFLSLREYELPDGSFVYEESDAELEEILTENAKALSNWSNKGKPSSPDKPVAKGKVPSHKWKSDGKKKPKEKWTSSGCVVFDSVKDMSKVYVIQQKNWNTWSFPKGRVDAGESLKKTAVREVAEETGLQVALLPSGYLGKGVGSFSVTHFYAAVRTGGTPGQHDQEVSQVKLVSFTEAFKLFKKSGGKAGNRDLMMLRKAWEYSNKYRRGKVPPWPAPGKKKK